MFFSEEKNQKTSTGAAREDLARSAPRDCQEARKVMFFSEEKNQKTSFGASREELARSAQTKVFASFSKKKPFLPEPTPIVVAFDAASGGVVFYGYARPVLVGGAWLTVFPPAAERAA